ncbi:MAG: hypothetical protein JJE39_08655 [Vicinamibacteria bacterium]|nr:hypothetical protein [Vicinamibacteria bacterium]
MSTHALDRRLLQSLSDRFRLRLRTGLTLARMDRFVQELEPSSSEGPDVFADLAAAFRTWRRALKAGDAEACLDAMEATWSRLDACRRRVEERDAVIEAFRLRWAGENANLSHQTVDALARFYRLLPCTTSSQSKYEYVLTRRLAGPLVPDRWLPPTVDLLDAVTALEASWGAAPLRTDDREVEMITLAVKSFGHEASAQKDAAGFTSSAVLRRFGAFKASIGEKLLDPRLSVAVVETNVRVLNALNQLLTDAGGQPLRGGAAVERAPLPVPVRPRLAEPDAAVEGSGVMDAGPTGAVSDALDPKPPVAHAIQDVAPADAVDAEAGSDHRSSEIDISGMNLSFRRPRAVIPPPPAIDEALPAGPDVAPSDPSAATSLQSHPDGESPSQPTHPDLRTGEVDLSGLEFVRRFRRPQSGPVPAPEPTKAPETDLARAVQDAVDQEPEEEALGLEGPDEDQDAAESEFGDSEAQEAEQMPSSRAFELTKIEGNEELIARYLTRPRSPEVWRLNLDSFFCAPDTQTADAASHATERRRAFELILTADDLICLRQTQEGAPTAEHRARVKDVAQSMLRLQTALRRAAGLSQGGQGELEPLLYVSDHLLWERLRLSASLKRNPVRKRPLLLPRATRAAEAARLHSRVLRRHRRILVWAVMVAVILTSAIGLMGVSAPRLSINREVRVMPLAELPEPQVFEDARAFRNRLFMTADASWTRLGQAEQKSIMRSFAAFAAQRGFDTVSVIGPNGETWATFKDNEIILATDIAAPPGNQP